MRRCQGRRHVLQLGRRAAAWRPVDCPTKAGSSLRTSPARTDGRTDPNRLLARHLADDLTGADWTLHRTPFPANARLVKPPARHRRLTFVPNADDSFGTGSEGFNNAVSDQLSSRCQANRCVVKSGQDVSSRSRCEAGRNRSGDRSRPAVDPPDVVRIPDEIGSGQWAMFFRIVLTDDAARRRLRDVAPRLVGGLAQQLDFPGMGVFHYHNFRSVSEQAMLEPAWA
jgi:hypothetical protein